TSRRWTSSLPAGWRAPASSRRRRRAVVSPDRSLPAPELEASVRVLMLVIDFAGERQARLVGLVHGHVLRERRLVEIPPVVLSPVQSHHRCIRNLELMLPAARALLECVVILVGVPVQLQVRHIGPAAVAKVRSDA